MIAIGGYDNNSKQFLNTCERFSLKTEQWSAFPKLKVARRSPGVISYRGQVGGSPGTISYRGQVGGHLGSSPTEAR